MTLLCKSENYEHFDFRHDLANQMDEKSHNQKSKSHKANYRYTITACSFFHLHPIGFPSQHKIPEIILTTVFGLAQ